MTGEKHVLSENWKTHLIFVTPEEDQLELAIVVACNRLKMEKVKNEIQGLHKLLKQKLSEEEVDIFFLRLNRLVEVRKKISSALGRV